MTVLRFPVAHHATFRRTVTMRLRLTCRTGLHVGAGKSIDLVGSDLPVMRDAGGLPLIPGSSVRGVLRGGIEGLLETLGLKHWKPLPPEDLSPSEDPSLFEDREPMDEALAKGWREMNLTERLFGRISQESGGFSYASRLQISDLCCTSSDPIELRDGVAIDRESRTAKGGAKFNLEVVPAGACFEGRLRLRNPQDYEVGLVAQALWMLDEGLLLLGGGSARGLGWIEVAVTEPLDLSAKSILEGGMRAPGREFGAVEEKLGRYLDAVIGLKACQAEASSA